MSRCPFLQVDCPDMCELWIDELQMCSIKVVALVQVKDLLKLMAGEKVYDLSSAINRRLGV